MINKKYSWSNNETYFTNQCDTVEECLSEFQKTFPNDKTMYYGEIEDPKYVIDGSYLINNIYNQYKEQYVGDDFDWKENIDKNDITSLEKNLKSVIDEWLLNTNNVPNFCFIKNIKKVVFVK
jgi:hypothetical protein